MAKTPNFGLYITDDSSEKFIIWQRKENGMENSNMTIIDDALGKMARVILSETQPEDLTERDVWYREVE